MRHPCVGDTEVTDHRGSCACPPCYLSEWEERLQREVLRSIPRPRGHPGESVRSWRMRRRCALGPAYRLSRRHWVFHDKKGGVSFPSSPVSPENNRCFHTRGGGADGSIYTYAEKELAYHANDGIDEIIERQKPFIERYALTLTPGDL